MSNSQSTGIAYSDPEFVTCYASQELGYSSAAQGSVTQATSKSTGVTLSKSSGQITMNGAALSNGAIVSFTLTNTLLSAKDVLIINVAGGLATSGTYTSFVSTVAAGSAVISLYNISAGPLSEAVVINFAIIHSA
jgi:hypothetical protein